MCAWGRKKYKPTKLGEGETEYILFSTIFNPNRGFRSQWRLFSGNLLNMLFHSRTAIPGAIIGLLLVFTIQRI